jgi:biopolymer transport protein ExbD
MRKHYIEEQATEDINMTPMLDIVFILLIFFIVTSTFTQNTGIVVDRPDAKTANITEQHPLIVTISAQDEIWFNQKPVTLNTLQSILRSHQPDEGIIIVVDKETNSGLLIKVMDEIRQTGMTNIAIAANTVKK